MIDHECKQMDMAQESMEKDQNRDGGYPVGYSTDVFAIVYQPSVNSWCIHGDVSFEVNHPEFACPINFCPYCGVALGPPQSETKFQGGCV